MKPHFFISTPSKNKYVLNYIRLYCGSFPVKWGITVWGYGSFQSDFNDYGWLATLLRWNALKISYFSRTICTFSGSVKTYDWIREYNATRVCFSQSKFYKHSLSFKLVDTFAMSLIYLVHTHIIASNKIMTKKVQTPTRGSRKPVNSSHQLESLHQPKLG